MLPLAVVLWVQKQKWIYFILGAFLICSSAGLWLGYGQDYGRSMIQVANRSSQERMRFWIAAWKIGRDHPLFGTGPGTFAMMYPHYREAGDEDTLLVHNNYLQMWTDSGLAGFITFLFWLPGSLWLWLRKWKNVPCKNRAVPMLLWCACMTFALHSLVDFDLYMIGNSWPIFVLLGYLSEGRIRKL